jgi:hypothetical protein
MAWPDLLPILNGIVGGFVMTLVAWLVGTGKLTLGRETQGFKDLWDEEKKARKMLEDDRDNLVEGFRRNNEILIETSKALSNANNGLTEANKILQDIAKK